jgi:hypothetical protein
MFAIDASLFTDHCRECTSDTCWHGLDCLRICLGHVTASRINSLGPFRGYSRENVPRRRTWCSGCGNRRLFYNLPRLGVGHATGLCLRCRSFQRQRVCHRAEHSTGVAFASIPIEIVASALPPETLHVAFRTHSTCAHRARRAIREA